MWMLLVILFLASCAANPSLFERAGDTEDEAQPFELKEVISGQLSAKGFGGTWVSDTKFIYTDVESKRILLHDEDELDAEDEVLVKDMATEGMVSYSLSNDQLYLLFSYDVQPGFRHSVTAKYAVYNITSGRVVFILNSEQPLQLATWSPKNNALAYVFENDIYYIPEVKSSPTVTRVTYDGDPGVVYNGVPDWVYEEEVLGTGSALWFSPDGKWIAYAHFDDTLVQEATYMHYGSPENLDSQYATPVTIRYPKPGTANPDVELRVVQPLFANDSSRVLGPPTLLSDDCILTDVSWPNADEVYVVWTSRVQNNTEISRYDFKLPISKLTPVFTHKETKGWVDLPTPVFNGTTGTFATIFPWYQTNGARTFRHLTIVSVGVVPKKGLTSGQYVVTKIYGWDSTENKIYYQATAENAPSQRHVYEVSESGTSEPKCISCDIAPQCQFASASFSQNFKYFALTCSGPDVPFVDLCSTTPLKVIRRLQNNTELRDILKKRLMPKIKDVVVNVTGTFKAHVRLWLPPNLDESAKTKYPMVVFVYGGPNSQQITDAFTLGWGAYLSTNRSYIYAMIDGRGSGFKDDDTLFEIYRQLGTVEVEDQIIVARELQKTLEYVDANRTGIWGWSYGGYATAMALAEDTGGVFKCGISVAPVTSWIYYDTIYTERYMGLPTALDNLKGYDGGDVTRRVENFRNKQFLLMHGNADDNVHYQQSMMLSKALEVADILFEQQSYPDENHGIRSVITHVYHSQDRFWSQCFEQENTRAAGAGLVSARWTLVAAITALAAFWGP